MERLRIAARISFGRLSNAFARFNLQDQPQMPAIQLFQPLQKLPHV